MHREADVDGKPLGYWLKHIDTALEEALGRALAEEGVDRRGWQVLHTLATGGPATVAALDAALAPFLTGGGAGARPYADALAGRGWARADEDGALALTEEGRRAHRRLAERVGAVRGRVARCLSAEEYGTLIGLLRRVAAHLDGGPAGEGQQASLGT